jgi:hypothetical protein
VAFSDYLLFASGLGVAGIGILFATAGSSVNVRIEYRRPF